MPEQLDWLEAQINSKLKFFEKELMGNNFKKASDFEKEILILLKRLSYEEKNMDEYMLKYRRLINNEKAKMLHGVK